MVPQAKYITPNMLNRPFFDNHVFFQCEYDEKILINLNGRVIQSNNNQFQTYLGFKKLMTFNVIDEGQREVSNNYVKVVYIDNVIDETVYNQNNVVTGGSIPKRDVLKRFTTKDEYLTYFQTLCKKNEELREIEPTLNDMIEKLQNNYILIKNHVMTYSKYFQELGTNFRTV